MTKFQNQELFPREQQSYLQAKQLINYLQFLDAALKLDYKRAIAQTKPMIAYLSFQSNINIQDIKRIYQVGQKLRQFLKTDTPADQQTFVDVYLCLALISEMLKFQDTEKEYSLALYYDQYNPQANFSLAMLFYRQRKYRKSARHLRKISIRKACQSKHIKFMWIMLLLRLKINIYQQLSQIRIYNEDQESIAQRQFICSLIKFKQIFLYRCIQINELREHSFSKLAELLYNTNRFDDALTLTYKLRSINNPPTQQIQKNLAKLFYMLRKWQESIECAQQGLIINPHNQEIHSIMIGSLIESRRYQSIQSYVLKLLKINKYGQQAYQQLGMALLQQGFTALGLECIKLSAIIEPSQRGYILLASSLCLNGQLKEAQRYCLRSIKIKPSRYNYSCLGQLYLQANAHINAILCFFEALTLDYLDFRSYFNLGFCAKKNNLFKQIINIFMSNLKKVVPESIFLQVNLSIYQFISNQSRHQLFEFLSKFLEQKKKGEESIQFDIATRLIKGYDVRITYGYQDATFAIMMGILGRSQQDYGYTHRIYAGLINLYKIDKHSSQYDAFTKIYEDEISKSPKEVQAAMLQFIVAEMVQQNIEQALRCLRKSLYYAKGDYEQFYLQFYKQLEKGIDQLQLIDYIADSILAIQYGDIGQQQQIINEMMNVKQIEANQYFLFLERLKKAKAILYQQIERLELKQDTEAILKNLSQNFAQNKNQNLNLKFTQTIHHTIHTEKHYQLLILQKMDILNIIGCINESSLAWKIEQQNHYRQLYQQISSQEQCFEVTYQRILKIYGKQQRNINLISQIFLLVDQYSDSFVLSQKVKLVYNHFYPYIISEACHKQFALILSKIKNYPNYSNQQLREDLCQTFKESNKHTVKVFTVRTVNQNQQSEVNSQIFHIDIADYPLIDINQQTKSQYSIKDEYFQALDYFDDQAGRENYIVRQKSESKANNSIFQKEVVVVKKKIQYETSNSRAVQEQQNMQMDSQSQYDQSSVQISIEQLSKFDQSYMPEQVQWYQLQYSPQRTGFFAHRLYAKFNELLHLNTFFLIKYLSKQSNSTYIAKHICNTASIRPRQSFRAKVQLGDKIYQADKRGGTQIHTLGWIQGLGPKYVYRWIQDIALGIEQLENIGIYHADLSFRNTIRITKGRQFCFKIVDFDRAFKVSSTNKNDKSYECTKSLFDFWLRFKFDDRRPRAPIYSFYDQSQEGSIKTVSSTYYDVKDIIEYIFMGADQSVIQRLLSIKHQSIFSNKRIHQCLEQLRRHMRASHLKQFSLLVSQLLQNQHEHSRDAQILETLGQLKIGKIYYPCFAQRVKEISNKYKLI